MRQSRKRFVTATIVALIAIGCANTTGSGGGFTGDDDAAPSDAAVEATADATEPGDATSDSSAPETGSLDAHADSSLDAGSDADAETDAGDAAFDAREGSIDLDGGPCTPTATRCDVLQPQTCDSNGEWQNNGPACDYVCEDAMCIGMCAPSSQRCNGVQIQICSSSGQWANSGPPCPDLCVDGMCSGTCTPGAVDCENLQPRTCDSNGNWQNTGSPCPYVCSAGACTGVCVPGSTVCSGNDIETCNAMGQVGSPTPCPNATPYCAGGVCISEGGDTCAMATAVTFPSTSHKASVPFTNQGATSDLAAPCSTHATDTVWFSFTLTAPAIVYADTYGATFDTILYFANSCTVATPLSGTAGFLECSDDSSATGCTTGGVQSQIDGYFQAGTFYIVVAGKSGATGSGSLHVQYLPVGNDGASGTTPPAPKLLAAGSSTNSGTLAGTGLITSDDVLPNCYTNGGTTETMAGMGPEETYFWRTCPEYAGGAFTATTCGAGSLDSVIYVANADETGDCDDDNEACSNNSLSSILPHPTATSLTIPSGAGIHVFVVDAYGAGEGGAYTAIVTRP